MKFFTKRPTKKSRPEDNHEQQQQHHHQQQTDYSQDSAHPLPPPPPYHSQQQTAQHYDPRDRRTHDDRDRERERVSTRSHSESSSPTKSRSKARSSGVAAPGPTTATAAAASPSKAYWTTSAKKSARPASPALATSNTPTTNHNNYSDSTRHSRTFGRSSSDLGKSSSSSRRKKAADLNTHPLNLHPDEIRRLSALSAMSARESVDRMDIDSPNASAAPASPSQQKQPSPPAEQTPAQTPPATANGSSSPKKEDAPAPPPHTTDPNSPPPTPADEAEVFKALGNKFFKEKNYKRAIEEYTKAVELQPDSATYLGNRAAAYMADGRYEYALDDCKRAVDLDPSNPKILLRLARIYTNLGQPEEATVTFQRIRPPPSAKDMQQAKDMLQYIKSAQQGLDAGSGPSMVLHALDMAERLLGPGARKPRKWQLMRGEAYLQMGGVNNLGEAQTVATNLLRNNSQDPEALVLRARGLYGQGENDKAIKILRMAIDCDPDFQSAIKWLKIVRNVSRMKEEGNAEYKAGRWQSAIDKYTAALGLDPGNKSNNSKLLQNRALCYKNLKQYEKALADCDEALRLDPSYTKARKTKATTLGAADKWEDAAREWKALAEADPSDASLQREARKAELELKKSQRKDYYKILEVSKDADESAIKKSYRKLAIRFHPDKNPGNDEAEAKFKDISEAYETLSDPQKKARYDAGDDIDMSDMFGGGGGGGFGGGGVPLDPEILSQLFGQAGGGGFGGAGGFGGGGFQQFPGGGGRSRGFPGGFGGAPSGFHFG